MRALKSVLPIGLSVGLVLAVTAVLWRVNASAAGSHHLVYIYLFPVVLIAALYDGRLALFSAAIALISADYFLQKPLYVLGSDNPLEYGDLFVFALLAVLAIKFIRALVRPRTLMGLNHVRRISSGSLAIFAAICRVSSCEPAASAPRS